MPLPTPPALTQPAPAAGLTAALKALERRSGGRLGVAVLDIATGRVTGHRLEERFTFCSTFKALLAGAVLAEVDAGRARLEERLPFGAADLLDHAPVCRARLGEGSLSLEDLCKAILQVSDNTAANLLFQRFGGPEALTAYLRSLGDETTRSDRTEVALNAMAPGDPRDTTTPQAMAHSLARLLTGNALTEASRTRLRSWMAGATTGLRRLRAGIPPSWEVLDKTGTGMDSNPVNDVALVTPPGEAPFVVTAFLVGARGKASAREAILAEAARLVAAERVRTSTAAWKAELLQARQAKDTEFRDGKTSPLAGLQRLSVAADQPVGLWVKADGLELGAAAGAPVTLRHREGTWVWVTAEGESPMTGGRVFDLGPFHVQGQVAPDRLTLLVFDPQRPALKAFRGLNHFPPSPAFRVSATLEPTSGATPITLTTTRNLKKTFTPCGRVHFRLQGKALALTAYRAPGDDSLFIPFRDATTGRETYPVGRFLEVPAPKGTAFVLDFNTAFNPLCTYSDIYNCPIPPAENVLPVAVRAGERPPAGH